MLLEGDLLQRMALDGDFAVKRLLMGEASIFGRARFCDKFLAFHFRPFQVVFALSVFWNCAVTKYLAYLGFGFPVQECPLRTTMCRIWWEEHKRVHDA